jgi:hypothetical protein
MLWAREKIRVTTHNLPLHLAAPRAGLPVERDFKCPIHFNCILLALPDGAAIHLLSDSHLE